MLVNSDTPLTLSVRCTDANRGTFLDLQRGDRGHRQLIDPGGTFQCMVRPGPVEITFGYALEYTFEPAGDE